MEWLAHIGGILVPFLIVLTVLVFVHELGHYALARRNGVRVETFSIGFGPELFGWTARSGTRWRVSALPLGGYVKMFGDMDAASRPDDEKNRSMTPEERAVAFPFKSLSARAWIVAGGPLANFLFAIVLLTGLYLVVGQPTTPPVITAVVPGSAAEAAGLQPGDRIVSINGSETERFEDVQRLVQLNLDHPLDVVIDRDGAPVTLTAAPTIVTEQDGNGCDVRLARLGIQAQGMVYEEHGFFDALWTATGETWGMARDTLRAVWQIVTGSRGTDELGGPIRIAEMSGQVAQVGLTSLIWFMAILSVNLGLINLFPVPMLDGGHLLFYGIEALRGRPLGAKAQEYGFKIGIALVLSLMIFSTINDLVRIDRCVA